MLAGEGDPVRFVVLTPLGTGGANTETSTVSELGSVAKGQPGNDAT